MKKTVKAWAITNGEVICGHLRRLEIHATKEHAESVINSVEGWFELVPVTITYEIPKRKGVRK